MKTRIYSVKLHGDTWGVYAQYPGSLLDTSLGSVYKRGEGDFIALDGLVRANFYTFQGALGYFKRNYAAKPFSSLEDIGRF